MQFNQTTLRMIAEGGHMPDQEYVIEMAKALLKGIFIVPRLDGDKRPDGSPQWYDCFKDGVKRAEIYHLQLANAYSMEIDGNDKDWIGCKSLSQCEEQLKRILK